LNEGTSEESHGTRISPVTIDTPLTPMPSPAGRIGRYTLLRAAVILGLLAGFALSPKLWLSSRFYPLTPVWSFLKPLRSPGDYVVMLVLAALLIVLIVVPRRAILIAVFALLALLALQDQSRLQPWFYQYVLMLLAIALAGSDRQADALNTCCFIVAATYIWSGLAKLNPSFSTAIFPAFVEPFVARGLKPTSWLVQALAIATPVLECATGLGLLIKSFRPVALYCAIAMHVFILLVLGPLGRRFNPVIWPWNLAMIAFLLILFFRREDQLALREIVWGRFLAGGFVFQKVVLILFGVMPALSFFHLWDDYLSSALYTGNTNSGVIYLSDDAFEQLPDGIENHVYEEGPSLSSLDINDWSFDELKVPAYAEIRIYRNVAKHICGYVSNGSGVELVVQEKFALANGGRRHVYHCSDLQGGF
jgi:hypothetical protein